MDGLTQRAESEGCMLAWKKTADEVSHQPLLCARLGCTQREDSHVFRPRIDPGRHEIGEIFFSFLRAVFAAVTSAMALLQAAKLSSRLQLLSALPERLASWTFRVISSAAKNVSFSEV